MRQGCTDNTCRHRHLPRETYEEDFARLVGPADAEWDWTREDPGNGQLAQALHEAPRDEFTHLLVASQEVDAEDLLHSMLRLTHRDVDLQTYLHHALLHVQAHRWQRTRRLLSGCSCRNTDGHVTRDLVRQNPSRNSCLGT